MEHGRLTPPSILRLESEARARADRSPGKLVKRASDDFERATRDYLKWLNRVPSSGTVEQVQRAHDAARVARAKAENLDRALPTHAVSPLPEPSAVASLGALDHVLAQWTAYNAGVADKVEDPAVDWAGVEQSTVEEMQQQIREGRFAVLLVQDLVRPMIADIANRVAAQSAPGESTTGSAVSHAKEAPGSQPPSESGTRG